MTISPAASLRIEFSRRSQPVVPGPQSQRSSLDRPDRASALNKLCLAAGGMGAASASRSVLPAQTQAVSAPAWRSQLT